MMHPDFPIAPWPSFPFALALLACAAIGCGRSSDLFPDDAQSTDGCVGARVCAPEPSAEPCANRACEGPTESDIDDEPPPGEPEPTLTDPTTAQPSGELPLEPAEPDPEPTPAGPKMPEPSELSPEAPLDPLPELPALDAGIGADAGVEPPPDAPGGPGRPPRPPRP